MVVEPGPPGRVVVVVALPAPVVEVVEPGPDVVDVDRPEVVVVVEPPVPVVVVELPELPPPDWLSEVAVDGL